MEPRFALPLLLALGACSAPAHRSDLADREVLDLSYTYDEHTVYWPTASGFELAVDSKGWTESGFYYEANSFCTAEHGGTHLDAPIHFAEGRRTVDAVPVDQLIGPGVLIDVSAACDGDRDHLIGTAEIEAWEDEHGRIPSGAIVLLRTGFGRYWPDRQSYLGTDRRGPEAVAELHFPGLDPAATRWLVEERSIGAVGLDTASIDRGMSTGFESHCILSDANVPALENVARLDQLPPDGFDVIALPMKIGGGSGAPVRIVALLPPR